MEDLKELVFFNASHAIADGVSMGAVLTDLSDERDEIKAKVEEEMRRRRRKPKLSWLQRVVRAFSRLSWFVRGLVKFSLQQLRMMLAPGAKNPFASLMTMDATDRTISWVDAGNVADARAVAKHFGCTLHDLFVACVATAVSRQAREHDCMSNVSKVKIAVPVHLFGGVLLPKQEIGNRIGAVSAEVPTGGLRTLEETRESLRIMKDTPAPAVSVALAKLVSYAPTFVARFLMEKATKNTTVAISNVRGPEGGLHFGGRKVEAACGFVPPPPGVPIGVVVQSYNGTVTLTCNADSKVVPDGDKFLGWVLEEYIRCAREFNLQLQEEQ